MSTYRIYVDCARRAYFDIEAENELIADDEARDLMCEDDFEEKIAITDIFGEWQINQIERI